jgi:hypothetical protein
MKGIKLAVFPTVIYLIILGCVQPKKDIFGIEGHECKLWWIYDEGISNGPTPLFICINVDKYYTYSISRFGKLRKPKIGDVVYALTEHGNWEVRYDSLILQGKGFSTIKRMSDTIFLRPDAFLLDLTDKFNIENCDCDSLVAQFKGGQVDSIKTIMNYQNEKR